MGELNIHEINLVRRRYADKMGVYNTALVGEKFPTDKLKDYHILLVGFLGELAFAKELGVYPVSLLALDKDVVDNLFDFDFSGIKIEVKALDSCVTSKRCLLVNQEQHKMHSFRRPDYYVLISVSVNSDYTHAKYQVTGWITSYELLKPRNDTTDVTFWGKIKGPKIPYPAWAVDKDHLHGFPESILQKFKAL